MASNNLQLIFDILSGKDTLNPSLGKAKTNTKDLELSFSSLSKKANEFGSGITSKFTTLGGLGGILASAFAGFTLSKVIEEASQAEQSINDLNVALASGGNYTEKASKDIAEYAAQLQKVTKYSDDAILGVASYLENITKLDSEGLKKVTKSTIDLAAALNIDLQSATSLVSKAIEGSTGGLSRYGIKIKEGATQSERMSNVLQGLAKFTDQAEQKSNTYAGSMAKLGNAVGEVAEMIGSFVIKNPALINTINDMAKGIFDILPTLKELVRNFILFGTVVKNIFEIIVESVFGSFARGIQTFIVLPINFVIEQFNKLAKTLGSKIEMPLIEGFDAMANAQFDGVKADLTDIQDAFKKIGVERKEAFKNTGKREIDEIELKIMANVKGLKEITDQFGELQKSAQKLSGTDGFKQLQRKFEDFQEVIKKTDPKKMNLASLQKEFKNIGREVSDLAEKAKNTSLELPNVFDRFITDLMQSFKDFDFSKAFTSFGADFMESIKDPKNMADAKKIGTALVASISQGAEGARKLVVGILGSVAETIGKAFGPLGEVLGPAVGQLIDFFSQGPAKVRAMVSEFMDAFDDVIVNIIEGAVAFVETIIDKIPDMIDQFIDQIPGLMQRLGDQLPVLLSKAMMMMPTIANALIKSLIENAPAIMVEWGKALVQEAPKFVSALISELGKMGGSIGGIFGGGGGGGIGGFIGGIGSGIGDIFGLAEGGMIKSVPKGFSGDTYPARLTSDELIVDRSTTSQLKRFLDGNGTSTNDGVTNALLNQILSALNQPMVVESSVKVNDKAFADIILNLNRRNQRLTV